jgi:hypothetical protein
MGFKSTMLLAGKYNFCAVPKSNNKDEGLEYRNISIPEIFFHYK